MAIMIIKNHARKALVVGKINSCAVAPDGVGGLEGKPVIIVSIGEFRICIPKTDLNEIISSARYSITSIK